MIPYFSSLGTWPSCYLRKNDLKKRLEVIRKVHDKQSKGREIELNKEVFIPFSRSRYETNLGNQ